MNARFEAGGSLLDHVRRVGVLPPRAAAGVAMQVCDALAVAHRQGVIHRDLKPENVLIEQEVPRTTVPQIRVADFGIAKVFGGVGDRLTRVGAFIGTPQYAAPEQFDGMAPEPATDVYAVGALLYFCVTLRPVAEFMGELDFEEQREHLVRHLPPVVTDVDAPEVLWINETLAAAMTPDPGDRLAIDVLAERLHKIALGNDPGRLVAPAPMPPRSAGAGGETPAARAVGTISSQSKLPAGGRASSPGLSKDRPRPPVTAHTGGSLTFTRTGERGGATTAAKTSAGCAAVLVFSGVALALAAGAWWALTQPVQLTGGDADPARVADWQGIAFELGERGAAAERACATDPYLSIEVIVDGAGHVESARLLNYPYEPARACIERELRRATFPRKGSARVRVAVQMVK